MTDWRTETIDTRPPNAGVESSGALPLVLTLYIAAHPQADRVGESAYLPAVETESGAALSRIEPEFSQCSRIKYEHLGDPHLSRRPVVLRRVGANLSVDVTQTSTRVTVSGTAIVESQLVPWHQLRAGVDVVLNDTVTLLLVLETPSSPTTRAEDLGLSGVSARIRRVRDELRRVADTTLPVLLRGETGAGKEVAARAIHRLSHRSDGPYVTVNMGSLGASLAPSAIFGHRRGAFSGATGSHKGFFEQAAGGTLFLDEVGDTPVEVQVALLRAVETLTYRPLGSEADLTADVRLVSATDRQLEQAVATGTFRAPLYHRLAGFVVDLPPLRDRLADIPLLLTLFIADEARSLGEPPPSVGAQLTSVLLRYHWPGNVRELRNAARQIVVASRGSATASLPPNLQRVLLGNKKDSAVEATRLETNGKDAAQRSLRRPSDVGEDELIESLAANDWKIAPTATALRIARASLYDLINKSDRIRKAAELTPAELKRTMASVGSDITLLSRELCVSPRGLLLRLRALGLD